MTYQWHAVSTWKKMHAAVESQNGFVVVTYWLLNCFTFWSYLWLVPQPCQIYPCLCLPSLKGLQSLCSLQIQSLSGFQAHWASHFTLSFFGSTASMAFKPFIVFSESWISCKPNGFGENPNDFETHNVFKPQWLWSPSGLQAPVAFKPQWLSSSKLRFVY